MTRHPHPEHPSVANPQNLQNEPSEGFAGAGPMGVSAIATRAFSGAQKAHVAFTAPKQRGRPFPLGKSGNPSGRPKGARNKLTDVFLSAIVDDFAEHGANALASVRMQDPASYLRIIGGLIPRELILQREESPAIDYAELTPDELSEMLRATRKRKLVESALKAT